LGNTPQKIPPVNPTSIEPSTNPSCQSKVLQWVQLGPPDIPKESVHRATQQSRDREGAQRPFHASPAPSQSWLCYILTAAFGHTSLRLTPKPTPPRTRCSLTILALLTLFVTPQFGCTNTPPVQFEAPPAESFGDPIFKPGDKIHIQFSADIPSIWFQKIADDGTLPLPLNQSVHATGKTPPELERIIHEIYVPALLTNLTVKVHRHISRSHSEEDRSNLQKPPTE
jgi:hypothetical protein